MAHLFIFDPATYYGDRETDVAFTYMFGGFSSAFYQGYQAVYPLDEGFSNVKHFIIYIMNLITLTSLVVGMQTPPNPVLINSSIKFFER